MKKTGNKNGFTLLELTISISLWIILLGVFSASFIFGLKHLSSDTKKISEYTRVSLLFENLQNLIQDKGGVIKAYKGNKNAFIISIPGEGNFILYFYSKKDSSFDNKFLSAPYSIVLSKMNKNQEFQYGIGRRLIKEIAPPPQSYLASIQKKYLKIRITPFPSESGPYQTYIFLP